MKALPEEALEAGEALSPRGRPVGDGEVMSITGPASPDTGSRISMTPVATGTESKVSKAGRRRYGDEASWVVSLA
jgi:hypothetical protein